VQIDQLVCGLLAPAADEITCADCREQLSDYYEAVNAGGEIPTPLAPLAQHLARCPYCAEELQMLQATMTAWATGALPNLTQEPKFDLSFLHPAPIPVSIWVQNQVTKVRELFTEIRIHLGATLAAFGDLPSALTPTALPVLQRSEGEAAGMQVLILPAPAANLSMQLAVGPVVAKKAALVVKLNQADTGQPLANLRLMLYTAERRMLAGSTSDAEGSIVFRDLALGRYIIQVRTPEPYEIHLVLAEK